MAGISLHFASKATNKSSKVTTTKNEVLSGYTAITSDSLNKPVEGTIQQKAAATYPVSASDQTINNRVYLAGTQTIKGVEVSGLSAGNIKKGVNASVGNLASASGSYTTPSSGQSAVTAANMLSGYSAFVNGGDEIKGAASTKAAATYNTSTSDQTIAAGPYLTGAQTIKAVTTAGIDAGNIKKGVVVKVGDANSPGRIKNVTGTYTTVSSGKTAVVAGALAKGYSAFANGGGEVKGSITVQAAKTWTPGTSNQTIASNIAITGTQTISGSSNLVAGYILSGKKIFGVNGSGNIYKVYTETSTVNASKISFTKNDSSTVSCSYYSVTKHAITPSLYGFYTTDGSSAFQVGNCDGSYFTTQGTLFKITGNLVFSKAKIQVPTYSTKSATSIVIGY